ncbi:MAG TPA: aspartyl protease family protein, partial [Gemmatimonadales bacterium]|nr:aspartyl protease family protein [Gemmatimonadales bacterium]
VALALAEAFYRQRNYRGAAALHRGRGRAAMAAKLDALAGHGAAGLATVTPDGTRVPFAVQAVLPVLAVQVNGVAAHFLLDTGAGETIVDTAFARRIGAARFGADSAAYAAGQVGRFEHGLVDSLRVGAAVVGAVPVHLQSTRAFAPAAGGVTVDGIIGTWFLARFRSTIDFGGRQLILERRASAPEAGDWSIPFWLLGDHFVTLPATAGGVETLLVFDTGLAMPGGALVPSAGLLADAGVTPDGTAVTGVGGGGRVSVTPFQFPRLELGTMARGPVLAVAGAFPPTLERRFGPRIGGLVSHGFFADQRVTLDFDAMRMVVTASAPAVRDTVGPTPAPGPSGPTGAALPEDSLPARARTVVQLLRDRAYDRLLPLWSESLRARLTPESVGASWEGLVAAVGAVTGIDPAERLAANQVKVPVRFGRTLIAVVLTFDEAGLVRGITMQGG